MKNVFFAFAASIVLVPVCFAQSQLSYADAKNGVAQYSSDFKVTTGKAAATDSWFPDLGKRHQVDQGRTHTHTNPVSQQDINSIFGFQTTARPEKYDRTNAQ